jgi:hypothetical protein
LQLSYRCHIKERYDTLATRAATSLEEIRNEVREDENRLLPGGKKFVDLALQATLLTTVTSRESKP